MIIVTDDTFHHRIVSKAFAAHQSWQEGICLLEDDERQAQLAGKLKLAISIRPMDQALDPEPAPRPELMLDSPHTS
jgi:hypothetical protein